MRLTVIPIEARLGEPFYISIFSDLHIDSELCDLRALRRIAAERRQLPGHRAIAIGDVADLVLPPDLRRFRPSGRPKELAARDDFLSASIDRCVDILRGLELQWDIIGAGNHEDEILKRHGVDPSAIIARELGAHHGGYAGVIHYQVALGPRTGASLTIAYHHGAWGGKYAKGYIGARDWFDHLDGWDIAAYGHCHASRVDPEVRFSISHHSQAGWKLQKRMVFLLNCASFVSLDHYSGQHYTERSGYPPQPIAPPLIKVVFHRGSDRGRRVIEKHIKVEV